MSDEGPPRSTLLPADTESLSSLDSILRELHQNEGVYDTLKNKGDCQCLRGTFCCPVGGNGWGTVPQYLKDRVDGELGEQTYGQLPPAFLLTPGCAAMCETNRVCVACGRMGESGPCGLQKDRDQKKRRCALTWSIGITGLALLCFLPVALSATMMGQSIVQLSWVKANVRIIGVRVWNSSNEAAGSLKNCSGSLDAPDSDPACGSIFAYSISPGGVIVTAPENLTDSNHALKYVTSLYNINKFDDLELCQAFFGARQSMCTICKNSMWQQQLAVLATLGGLIPSILDYYKRWDRKYDINFLKNSRILAVLLVGAGAFSATTAFNAQCGDVLLAAGTGEMARGTYISANLVPGQSMALEWSIDEDSQVGGVFFSNVLTLGFLMLSALSVMCLPTTPEAGDSIKLTDPWDLGYENVDQSWREVESPNAAGEGKCGKNLACCLCLTGCGPNCFFCWFAPKYLLTSICNTCGMFWCVFGIANVIFLPLSWLCRFLVVRRPDDAPEPKQKRGTIRKPNFRNKDCEGLWKEIKDNGFPMQETMTP